VDPERLLRYILSNDLHATRTTNPTNNLEQAGAPSLTINQNVCQNLNLVDEIVGPVGNCPITMHRYKIDKSPTSLRYKVVATGGDTHAFATGVWHSPR
jgi:hypothetical protein